jgi:2-octaprenyl-6-methoxyphenol hydroxylase
MPDLDVLIAGSGMVGASLACALAGQGLRVATVEPVEPSAPAQPSYDDRVVALSLGSQRILGGVGAWDGLAGQATAIREVHVSDRGHFGASRLSAEHLGVAALGYVVEARAIGRALLERLAVPGGPERICPASVRSVAPGPEAVEVVVESAGGSRRLSTRLLVAADGARSGVREAAGIPAEEHPYRQSAVIANLTPARSHAGVAYERFTDSGPLALLPMTAGRCALVWTVPAERTAWALGLGDEAFLAAVQDRFGDRLGALLRVGRRSAHPLSLVRARAQVRGRVVVVGNAAHSLHPVAGQGFNLGLRDAAALAEVLVDAARAGGDPGAPGTLAAYAGWREGDQRQVTLFTDAVVRLFSSGSRVLAAARGLGLLAVDLLPGVGPGLARRMMGLHGRQPRLACGISI